MIEMKKVKKIPDDFRYYDGMHDCIMNIEILRNKINEIIDSLEIADEVEALNK